MHLRRAENSNLFPNLSNINFCPILTHLVIHFNHEQIVGGPQCNLTWPHSTFQKFTDAWIIGVHSHKRFCTRAYRATTWPIIMWKEAGTRVIMTSDHHIVETMVVSGPLTDESLVNHELRTPFQGGPKKQLPTSSSIRYSVVTFLGTVTLLGTKWIHCQA